VIRPIGSDVREIRRSRDGASRCVRQTEDEARSAASEHNIVAAQPRDLASHDSAGHAAHQKGERITMEYDIEDLVADELTDSSALDEVFADDPETLVALKIKRSD
jgi:hypothetical protein